MAEKLKEIAMECGVSEQAIRGWCRRNHVAKDAKGSFAISESVKTQIYRHYGHEERNYVAKDAKANSETCESNETALIAMLQRELEVKNQQLTIKDKQIEELNARLAEISNALVLSQQTAQAEQLLHAGTMQKLSSVETEQNQQQTDTDVESQTEMSSKHKSLWKRLFGRD
ncbi:MAG: hypothetical protein LUG91_04005 [Ruminococcus sp.]|nr:hypothetical protein [Ruminococcus sp.]